MAETPDVSVIVPFYNARKTLPECMASIIAQRNVTYEAFFVNDGSSDDGCELVEPYVAKHPHFHLIQQSNAGVSVARNRGLEMARGRFVLFLDADDELMPGGLSALVEAAEDSVDLVIGSHESFRRIGPFKVGRTSSIVVEGLYPLGGFAPIDALDALLSTPWAKLYRTDTIKANGLSFEGGVPLGEDTRFNLAYCMCSRSSVKTVSIPVYLYAKGGAASSRRYYPDILDLCDGLLCAYDASSCLFSQGYVGKLRTKFLDGALRHLYCHNTTDPRRISLELLRKLVSNGALLTSGFDSKVCERPCGDSELESFLIRWEKQNKRRILTDRVKHLIKGGIV